MATMPSSSDSRDRPGSEIQIFRPYHGRRDESLEHRREVALLSGIVDVDVAVTALERAGARFMLVDNRGTEYATEADVETAEQRYASRDFYTPNYVAAPKVLDDGVELYVDCKGVIPPPMGVTFRKILREELVFRIVS
ncbi:MAG: hypothetical protein LC749_06985 [Actinobacteria bacterium]|nr:hypothetical protein [Actinomycetota bacterium]